jgi:hypothetical protein
MRPRDELSKRELVLVAMLLTLLGLRGTGVEAGGTTGGESMRLPTVSGRNPDRERVTFPDAFAAEYYLAFVAFQQWQQGSINTWTPFAQELESERDDQMCYEFPVLDPRPVRC